MMKFVFIHHNTLFCIIFDVYFFVIEYDEKTNKSSNLFNMSNLLSKVNVANYFNVTLPTINRWMKIGYLPFIKIGRRVLFDPQEIEDIKNKHRITQALGTTSLEKEVVPSAAAGS